MVLRRGRRSVEANGDDRHRQPHCTAGAATAGINIQHWMTAYGRSGPPSPFSVYAAGLGFTALICTSIILHRVRTLLSIYPRQLNWPAGASCTSPGVAARREQHQGRRHH